MISSSLLGSQLLCLASNWPPKHYRNYKNARHINAPADCHFVPRRFFFLQFSICPLIPEPTLTQTDVNLKSMNVMTRSIKSFVFQLVKKKKKEKSLSEDVSAGSHRISALFSSGRKIYCGGLEPRGATKQNLMSHCKKHGLEDTIPFPSI